MCRPIRRSTRPAFRPRICPAAVPNGPRPRLPDHAYQYREQPTLTSSARSSLSWYPVPRGPNAPFDSDSFYLYAAPHGPWLVNLADEDDAKVLKRDECIPQFAGEAHKDAFQWLQTFDSLAHANQWYSWDARSRMLLKYFKGTALEWWIDNHVYFHGWRNVEGAPLATAYFCGAFLTQFIQPSLFARWSRELHSARQERDETVAQYRARIRRMVSRVCLQEELSESTIAQRMLFGVMPDSANALSSPVAIARDE
ncbi:hypothetical protein THASP1DRAFT_26802 [Thamnocephalis sphaerospora]|uniref:Retrotransposon gag domain-containing protein n=1 Tax=Thamnocephalis sphaerospora TaxID=78915 RepID=A0A4V1IVM7_9FUNG|nr:hypothetical protein THASP1DRAFT_26802 [Thamnocephalis sphaerospora]|eukprot:RKP04599.1 hypothetical protein THASP1DRAFT_26802 [Thamnocephalis sphaerospora]